MQRLIMVHGKVRTDPTYPAGFMDVITIEKTGENFRLIYDIKGRFTIHRISNEEAAYKLCKVRNTQLGAKGVPFVITHDGRTIRYPDPLIQANDTVPVDIASSKITDIKFDSGNLCMITGGRNLGGVGTVVNPERHPGSFDIVHTKDSQGNVFATRLTNVFIIGKGNKPYISLPKGKGVKLSIAEEILLTLTHIHEAKYLFKNYLPQFSFRTSPNLLISSCKGNHFNYSSSLNIDEVGAIIILSCYCLGSMAILIVGCTPSMGTCALCILDIFLEYVRKS
ncbi:small ribosomal subunit protein eS4-like [Haematobia irritans]|uniref:small ribosomal subunit protein eS4-like n=1 Tax=Haematobia irritans TaxID=7368 RepID=UPI003F50CC15